MRTLAEAHADIPSSPFECIAVVSPRKCIVEPSVANNPSLELSWNTQLLNVAEAFDLMCRKKLRYVEQSR